MLEFLGHITLPAPGLAIINGVTGSKNRRDTSQNCKTDCSHTEKQGKKSKGQQLTKGEGLEGKFASRNHIFQESSSRKLKAYSTARKKILIWGKLSNLLYNGSLGNISILFLRKITIANLCYAQFHTYDKSITASLSSSGVGSETISKSLLKLARHIITCARTSVLEQQSLVHIKLNYTFVFPPHILCILFFLNSSWRSSSKISFLHIYFITTIFCQKIDLNSLL